MDEPQVVCTLTGDELRRLRATLPVWTEADAKAARDGHPVAAPDVPPSGHIGSTPPNYGWYTKGCRCDGCRAAGTDYQRARRWMQPATRKVVDGHDGRDFDPAAWMTDGNCAGVDVALFFPERGDSTYEAKKVCRGCAVRQECLDYALANGEKFGIWGGMSERERRRLRIARNRSVA
jgi:WhiB family redox-sensing transcriptional regulator